MVEDTNNICTENSATLCINILARFGRISFKLGKIPNFKRYSFRKCRWIFAYWSLSKLEEYHGWIYSGGDAAHVYNSFSQPLIRRKQLGELIKHVGETTSEVSEQGAGETTVNRIRHLDMTGNLAPQCDFFLLRKRSGYRRAKSKSGKFLES